jgi:hypothetical protein
MLTYEELVVNLKVLKKLEKHQKLNTHGVFLNVEAKSIIPEFIRRWRRGDDRNITLQQINATVATSIELIPRHAMLKKYLAEVVPGLENLKETYSTCSQTCARLDAIIDTIYAVVPPVEQCDRRLSIQNDFSDE